MTMTTVGEALNIPESVFSDIEAAQKTITDLGKSTEDFINKIGPKWKDAMELMAQKSNMMAESVANDFKSTIPEAIDVLIRKLREASGEMGKLGDGFGEKFADSLKVPSSGTGQAAIDISELAQVMGKLVEGSGQAVGSTTALADQMNRLITPLTEASTAIRKFAEAQTSLTHADVKNLIDESAPSKIEALKSNLSGLLTLLEKLGAAKVVPNQSTEQLALLESHIKDVTNAITEYHKKQSEKAKIPALDDVLKKIEDEKSGLNALKQAYRDLFTIMGSEAVGSQAFQSAAVAAVNLRERIQEVEYKVKMLPMGIEQFGKALGKMNSDQLRQIYWVLMEARDGAVKGSEAYTMYENKLRMVKEAMVAYVQALGPAKLTLAEFMDLLANSSLTISGLHKAFRSLQEMLSRTTWHRDTFGQLKPDMEGLEEAIGRCVVKMNEYNRAQQDVLAAAKQVGGAALQDIYKNGVESRNSVELERLSSDLKTAMRYLDENSRAWEVYRQYLAKVEAQQSVLDAKMGDTERSVRRVKEEVIYAADSLGYYQRELQKLNSSARSNAVGSSQWAQDVQNISEFAGQLERAKRQTEALTMSSEAFKVKIAGIKDEGSFRQLAEDMFSVRRAMRESGADVTQVEDRLRQVLIAWREWNAEQNKPKGRTLDQINESIRQNHNNLAVLKKDYQDIMQIVLSSDYGSKAFYDAGVAASSLAAHIKRLEQDEKLLTQPLEQFNASLKGLDKGGLESLRIQLEGLKSAAASVGATSEVMAEYQLRINAVKQAISDLNAAAASTIPPRGLRDIITDINALQRPLKDTQADYKLLLEAMNTTLPGSRAFADAARWADKFAERIRQLTAEQDRYKRGMSTMTEEILKAYSGSTDGFKSMGMNELEQTLQRIKTCMDGLSRSDMSAYTTQWNQLNKIWQDGNAELTRMKTEQADLMAKFDFQKSSWTMDDRSFYANNLTGMRSLEELRALQQALYNDISKCDNLTGQSALNAIAGYRKVCDEVKTLEKSIKGVVTATKEASGSKRGFDAIEISIRSADATMKTLMADFNDLRQKAQDMRLDVNTAEWQNAYYLMGQSVSKMESFRDATIAQNQQVQFLLDKIAMLNREMAASGSAAVGRYQAMGGFSGGGIAGLEASIRQVDTTAEKLKQDLSDVQTLLQKTPKFDAAGNVTKEWTELCRLEKLAMETLEKYNREKKKASTTKPVASYSEAMAAANTAKSYNELKEAIKKIKQAMNSLDPNKDASKWNNLNAKLKETQKSFDDMRRKMGELKERTKTVHNALMNLKNTIMVAFSISAIKGFLTKMVEVHAQMRLQNVALRAIIQNKHEADKIFSEVQQMAMRSPFSIMQLTTYTKQLAAYRIESEKLVETTKMLADVSAGLGVDMNRLILAYGQVKAANYLRATEVRQFTEAGLNIAGELAAYLSEVRGEMITVADVMDMISKRMVKFEDVEEVFKRITSAGGLFYDMQKKQADTVHGQMQRIKDAYTIMLDEIGQGNSGVISNVLTAIRELMANWRPIALLLKETIIVFGMYKLSALSAAFATSKVGQFLRLGAINAKVFGTTMKGLSKILGQNIAYSKGMVVVMKALGATLRTVSMGILGFGIGWLIEKIYELRTAGDAAREALANIREEVHKDSDEAVERYKTLADRIKDVRTSTEERAEALSEMNRVYGDYLPKQMRDIDGISAVRDGYREATIAIRAHFAEVERAKRTEYFTGEYNKKLQSFVGDTEGYQEVYGINEAEFMRIVDDVIRQADTTAENVVDKLRQALGEYTGRRLIGIGEMWEKAGLEMSDLRDILSAWENVMTANTDRSTDEYEDYFQGLNSTEADFARRSVERVEKVKSKYSELDEEIRHLGSTYNILRRKLKDNSTADVSAEIEEIKQMYSDIGLREPTESEIRNIVSSTRIFTQEMMRVGEDAGTAFVDSYRTQAINMLVGSSFGDIFAESLSTLIERGLMSGNLLSGVSALLNATLDNFQSEIEGRKFNDNQSWIEKLIIDTEGDDMKDLFQSIGLNAESTAESVGKEVKNLYEMRKAMLDRYLVAIQHGVEEVEAQELFLNGKSKDWFEKELAAINDVKHKLGIKDDEKRGRQGQDIWTMRLDLMKKTNSEYEKLLKYYDKETAKARILESFAPAAREIFAGTQWEDINTWGEFDKENIADQLEKALNSGLTIRPETRKRMQETLGQLRAEIDIKIQENSLDNLKTQIDELFDNYDLTKTLSDAGLNVNLTYRVGGKPMNITQLKREVTDIYNTAKNNSNLGEDAEKAYQDWLKKIADIEQKSQIERLKNYNKYLLESFSERVQIELRAQQEINKIQREYQDGLLDEQTMNMAIASVRKKEQEDIDKQIWEDFKGSDMYIDLFSEAAKSSKQSIDFMLEQLDKLKVQLKSLPADQLRAIVKDIDKLMDTRAELAPYQTVKETFSTAMEYLKTRNELELDYAEKVAAAAAAQLTLEDSEREVAARQEEYNNAVATGYTAQIAAALVQLVLAQKNRDAAAQARDDAKQAAENSHEAVSRLAKAFQQFGKAMNEITKRFSEYLTHVNDVVTALDEMGLVSRAVLETWESISDALTAVSSGMQSIISSISSGNYIGAGFAAVTMIAKVTASIFSIGDKKKQRQIERMIDSVETLQRSYEKLKEAMDNAYRIDKYQDSFDKAQQNLEAQLSDYYKILELEKSKKKKDKDAIKDYEEKIADIKDQLKELADEKTKAMGGFGEDGRLDAASNFVDAWLDAFQETGDGLDALKDSWDDYIENLLKKQAAYRIVGKRMESFFNRIDEMANANSLMSMRQILETIQDIEGNVLEKANEELKEFFDYFGWTGSGELLLSDLQQGIQNITEEQAAALESITNSIRFGVWQQVDLLDNILETIKAQYGSGDGAQLDILKGIRNEVTEIRSLLSSVIRRGTETGGRASLKVC